MGNEAEEIEADAPIDQLDRLPDLSKSLMDAPPHVQRAGLRGFRPPDRLRQGHEACRNSEAVADAFENAKALQVEACSVVVDT
jgi:hypothetical protein